MDKPLKTREEIIDYIVNRIHMIWDMKTENDIPEDTTLEEWRFLADGLFDVLYIIEPEHCVELVKRNYNKIDTFENAGGEEVVVEENRWIIVGPLIMNYTGAWNLSAKDQRELSKGTELMFER